MCTSKQILARCGGFLSSLSWFLLLLLLCFVFEGFNDTHVATHTYFQGIPSSELSCYICYLQRLKRYHNDVVKFLFCWGKHTHQNSCNNVFPNPLQLSTILSLLALFAYSSNHCHQTDCENSYVLHCFVSCHFHPLKNRFYEASCQPITVPPKEHEYLKPGVAVLPFFV